MALSRAHSLLEKKADIVTPITIPNSSRYLVIVKASGYDNSQRCAFDIDSPIARHYQPVTVTRIP